MTLAETCDRIEAALEIVEMPLCKAYLRTLVELGGLQWDSYGFHDYWRPKPEEIACLNRFNELKARVAEAVGK